jgi:hypothetical protein
VVLLIDGVEHKNVALVFCHRDAHALHTNTSLRFLMGIADIDLFPMRFNEAKAH